MKCHSLWFLDSELKNDFGHYANFAEKIIEAAGDHNLKTIVAGNRLVIDSVAERLNVAKAFHGMMHSYVPLGKVGAPFNPLIGSRVHFRELCRSLPEDGRGAIALAATANHRHFPALGKWVTNFPPARAPQLVVYLRFHFRDRVANRFLSTASLVRRGLKLLERASHSRPIILICDSQQLAEEYREITSLRIETLPVPHMIPSHMLAASQSTNGSNHAICFSYLGEARMEKGFDLLVKAIQRLREMPEWRDARLRVHSYHHPMYHMHGWTRKLLEMPEVECISDSMDSQNYYKMLLESDVIVMPYRRSTYIARSSGIFVDALAAGKPVVATEGTWMSEQLKRFGAGMLCKDNDPVDLARAMIEAKRSFPQIKQRAVSGKQTWIEAHNANVFFTSLLRLAEAS
jgi:glycosyltransferase involved in cell wall biosynthesis